MNCQRVMGILTGLLGMATGLFACLRFGLACWGGPRAHLTGDHLTIAVVGTGLEVDVLWTQRPGYMCMAVAIALKAVDVLCHLLVPTPPAKRAAPTEEYEELPQYLRATAGGPTRWGKPLTSFEDVSTSRGGAGVDLEKSNTA